MILTLGQAFEVAYQMALRDKLGGQTVRSQSANQLATLTVNNTANTKVSTPDSVQETHANSEPSSTAIDSKNTVSTNNSQNTNTNTLKSKSKTKLSVSEKAANSNHNSHGNSNNAANNSNSHGISISVASNCTSTGNSNASTKPLVTHGRSHSVNDIKINGNQLKLAPTPVDDIGVGVKDMKPGSRAPIALSEEL